jgi:hypothetical protein
LSKNALLTKEAGKVIGDMLKGNSTLKELGLSSNYDYDAGATDGPGFAQELADGIKDNGALSKFVFGGDTYRNASTGWKDITPEPATLEVDMTEANFSNKNLGVGGAIIVSAWITHKDKGALVKLDISSNNITAAQGRDLQRICAAGGIELVK